MESEKRPDWPEGVIFGFRAMPCLSTPTRAEDLTDAAKKFKIAYLYTFASRNPIVSCDWCAWECLAFTMADLYRLVFDKYGRTEKMCNAMDLIPIRVPISSIPEQFIPDLYRLHAAAQMLEKKYE
jgi:hypothetical protein